MKRNAIVRIVLFSILALALISVLMGGISMKLYNKRGIVIKKGSDAPVVQDNNFSTKDIDSLKISWVTGDIVIVPTDSQQIQVCEEILGSEEPMILKKGGSQLIVEYSQDNLPIKVGNPSHKNLYIAVPQDWVCRQLEIDAASANVRVEHLTIEEVEVDTASGTHTFDLCAVQSLKMDTASGDLDFTGSLDELDFNSASARADISLTNQPKSIKLDSMSGDLDLTLPEGCGFTVKKDTLSGSCTIEQDTVDHNGKLVHGDGACEIEINGLSSSVHIREGDATIQQYSH